MLDSAIHWINHCPAVKYYSKPIWHYLVIIRGFSSGQCFSSNNDDGSVLDILELQSNGAS